MPDHGKMLATLGLTVQKMSCNKTEGAACTTAEHLEASCTQLIVVVPTFCVGLDLSNWGRYQKGRHSSWHHLFSFIAVKIKFTDRIRPVARWKRNPGKYARSIFCSENTIIQNTTGRCCVITGLTPYAKSHLLKNQTTVATILTDQRNMFSFTSNQSETYWG